MHRTLVLMIALAAVLAALPRSAQAQVPMSTNGSLVAIQPVTDGGATSPTVSGLRGLLADLLQLKGWFSASGGTAIRAPKASVRDRRAIGARSSIRVP